MEEGGGGIEIRKAHKGDEKEKKNGLEFIKLQPRKVKVKLKTLFNQTMVLGDHKVKRCYRQGEEIIIELERRRRKKVRCRECGGRGILYGHVQERRWRHVDLWGKRVYVTYQPYRIQCRKCGVHVEAMSWSRGKQPWTIPFVDVPISPPGQSSSLLDSISLDTAGGGMSTLHPFVCPTFPFAPSPLRLPFSLLTLCPQSMIIPHVDQIFQPE